MIIIPESFLKKNISLIVKFTFMIFTIIVITFINSLVKRTAYKLGLLQRRSRSQKC